MRKLTLFGIAFGIVIALAACTPTPPQAASEAEITFMLEMIQTLRAAHEAGVTEPVEVANGSGYEYTGEGWTAPNGYVLKSGLYTSSTNPDTKAIEFVANATVTKDEATQTLKFSVSGTRANHTYSLVINDKARSIDLSNFPVFAD